MDIWSQDTVIRAELAANAAEHAQLWTDAAVIAETEVNLASLAHRWHRATRTVAPVMLTCTDGHLVRGRCVGVLDGFVIMQTDAATSVVATAHLAAVEGLPQALPADTQVAPNPRSFLTEQSTCAEVATCGGLVVVGRITVVGPDHLEVQRTDASALVIPIRAIIRIHWRR